jgi:hypothetical protein
MKRTLVFIGIIIAVSAIFFRSYLFGGKLLFPTNMLVAFYPPWKTMTFPGWRLIPFKGLGHDNVLFFYPEKLLLQLSLKQKSLPLWNPYNFGGTQLFGDGQAAPMYPLTLLYLLLPLPEAFSIMVILIPTLTMLFTFGMLRHFRLTRAGALLGAIAFAFCGFMSGWMEENPAVAQSAIWLPLLVWMTDLVITAPRRRWFVVLVAATATMMAAGFLQVSLYALLFMTAYAFFRVMTLPATPRIKKIRFFVWMLAVIIGLSLIGPYLTTTWEAYKLSPRDFVPIPEIRSIFLVPWSHLLSLFNPDWLGNPGSYNYLGAGSYYDRTLFIGVVPLLFVFIGLFSKKSLWEKFFWWMAVATLLMGFSSPFTQWLFGLPIPILTSMLPSRIFYLTSFALSVASAVAFDRSRSDAWYGRFTKSIRPVITVYLLIIILLELFLLASQTEMEIPMYPAGQIAAYIRSHIVLTVQMIPKLIPVLIRNTGTSIAITTGAIGLLFLAYRFKRIRVGIAPVLILVTIVSAWYFTGKSLYFGERQFLYPDYPMLTALKQLSGIHRVGYADELARVHPDANVVYGFYTFEGLNPVFPYRYGQLVKSAVNGGRLTNDIPRISVFMDLQQANDASNSARVKRLLSLADVKYIVERKESGWYRRVFPNHISAWEGTYYRIWENPDVLPRAFIATTILPEKNPQKILDDLYNQEINLRTTAIIDERVSASVGNNDVTIDSYRMNDVAMHYRSSSAGLLVVTDTWAPGWHALVDGSEAPVYRTDFTFRGVPVPAGNHKVFLYYWPQSFVTGLWIMGGGIIILLGSLIFIRWKKIST